MRKHAGFFVDSQGRAQIYRGANLSGSSKIPLSEGPEGTSFIGRPFPIEDADEHLTRLARWGFNFVRLVVTWEAIEPKPGVYDEAYLAYLRKVVKACEAHGLAVYVDPHQDIWSRATGGDGAPVWTLEAVGIDPARVHATGAALLRSEMSAAYPQMLWPSNYSRYAAATMFTLFFAGSAFAPKTLIDGEPADLWLQSHYTAAFRHCYRRLKDCKAIVGFGSMNEPSQGFIGCPDLRQGHYPGHLALGPMPSPFQAMAAASGHSVQVPSYAIGPLGPTRKGSVVLNPEGLSLFAEGRRCPWFENGVWAEENTGPVLIKPKHFFEANGKRVVFNEDFFKPFVARMAKEYREVRESCMVFVEGVPNEPGPDYRGAAPEGFVDALHWYDGATLMLKRRQPLISYDAARDRIAVGSRRASYKRQIAALSKRSREQMGGPLLFGEFGLPFDLKGGKAYRTGDFRAHEAALSAYYDAMDATLASCCIWNYTPDNTNAQGDMWNGEDLSIYSRDQASDPSDPDSGARALRGFARPYAELTAGRPLSMRFDSCRRVFDFTYEADPGIAAPTVIVTPAAQWPRGFEVELRGLASYEIDIERGRVLVRNEGAGLIKVRIRPGR